MEERRLPPVTELGMASLALIVAGGIYLASHLPNVAFVVVMATAWLIKVFVFCGFQLLIRWSLPRFRSDQLMQLGWQRLLPVSIVNVVVTAAIILWARM